MFRVSRDNTMPKDQHENRTGETLMDYCNISIMKILRALTKPRMSDSWFNWVVAASCMIIIFGTFGVFRSSGVLFAEVIHVFDVDRELAAWPFAVAGVLNSFSGIVCGPMTAVLPVRVIVIVGISASAFGLGMCYFTFSILWITVGYGIFFGMGSGLVYVCLPMVINDYFKKNRTTGNGILLAGTPLGVIVLAPLSELLITTYALRGTFLFLSAVCLQTLVFAALLNPAKPLPTSVDKVTNKHLKHVGPTKRMDNLRNGSNTEELTLMLDIKDESGAPSARTDFQKTCSSDRNELYVLVQPSLKPAHITIDSLHPKYFELISIDDYQKTQTNIKETDNASTEVKLPNCEPITSSDPVGHEISVDVVPSHVDHDITEAVISVVKESNENISLRGKVLELLKNPYFLLMTFNFMVVMTAIQTVTNVLVDYAEDKGVLRESAVMLLTVISIPEFFTRVCSGWITDKGFVRIDYLLIISHVVGGACVFAISFVYSMTALCVFLVLFGISSSTFIVLVNVFCLDNFQKDLLGFVFGIRHASMIIACLIRPWMIGLFRDHLGSYDYMFQTVGGITAITGFLWAYTLYSERRSTVTRS